MIWQTLSIDLKIIASKLGDFVILVKVRTALKNISLSLFLIRSIKFTLLLPLEESETITSSVFMSIANKKFLFISPKYLIS